MELDESIVQLGEKLDAWCSGFFPILDSEDRAAQGKALLVGIEIQKKLDSLKAQGLAAITALLNRRDAVTDDERASSLVRGFEFATKLADTLHEELLDMDGVNKVARLKNAIATELDAVGPGRVVLAALLDHHDARVRASAGAYLINRIPDRVLPILKEIEQGNYCNRAYFPAHWALLDWELKHKERST